MDYTVDNLNSDLLQFFKNILSMEPDQVDPRFIKEMRDYIRDNENLDLSDEQSMSNAALKKALEELN